MTDLPFRISDLKKLSEIGFVLVGPLFVVAYSLQFGILAHPDIISTMHWISLTWSFLGDCATGLGGTLFGFAALVLVSCRLDIPQVLTGLIFISLGLLGLVALEFVPAPIHANQFWFWGLLALGFVLMQAATAPEASSRSK